MFITVKYGNDESLLCNPSCAVVNLLNSIKRRAGMSNNQSVMLDLSDVTGLVKDLDTHKTDNASKHLSTHTTYILVEKQIIIQEEDNPDGGSPIPNIQYIPLLDNYTELFPEYRLHFNKIEKKKKRINQSKSPSPAGIRGIKGARGSKTLNSRSSSKKSIKS